ncbi:MAG: hypothetical protein K2K39_02645 [Clostridia bacterium]|nr:hypothetical protein [Clostridia bacterium]
MQSIIEEIFYGKRGQADKIEPGEEYHKLGEQSLEIYNKFYSTLTPEQKKLCDDIYSIDAAREVEDVRAHYIEGFKIGFLIAVECLTK